MKYRKLPVTIEAWLFNGALESVPQELHYTSFDNGLSCSNLIHVDDCTDSPYSFLNVPTLEGTMRANVGDYIIKGVNGEFYPCKPDIFQKTYELVKE